MKKLILLICLAILSFSSFASIKRIKENLVLVEGGELKVDEINEYLLEDPQKDISINYNYYVSKYEFTRRDWEEMYNKKFKYSFSTKSNTNPTYEEKTLNNYLKTSDYEKPLTYISWMEAIEICNKLSLLDKLPVAYDKKGNLLDKNGKITNDITKVKGYRLLTWAEWQFAAQGGEKSKGFKYSGGNDLDEISWNYNNSFASPKKVGLKKANELGLYDMTGNVSEMCTDYLNSKVFNINPVGLKPEEDLLYRYPLLEFNTIGARAVKGGSIMRHCFDRENEDYEVFYGKFYWDEYTGESNDNVDYLLKDSFAFGHNFSYDLNVITWIWVVSKWGNGRGFRTWEIEPGFYNKQNYIGFRIGRTAN